MKYFSTEFPQRSLPSKAAFIAQVVMWLRGTDYSTVVNAAEGGELDGVAPVIRAESGEELRFRFHDDGDGRSAIGFRHDFPDDEGRLWRTEAVCCSGAGPNGQDLIRLRTQCIARVAGARLDSPKKPFLLKSILTDGWGGADQLLTVSDQPVLLKDDDDGLALAQTATAGEVSLYLPVIYFSAASRSGWALSEAQIKRLAYQLGGVAHVIVEPSRDFSFRLRELTDAKNVYGGSVGLGLPGRRMVRRFFLGGQWADSHELADALHDYAFALRSQMPAEGWDWTELQEQALRQQRERERNRLTTAETEALYEEEIANLRDQVNQLKDSLNVSHLVSDDHPEQELLPTSIASLMGPEIYPGEVIDRLRVAAKTALTRAEQEGLDSRSKLMLERFATVAPSVGLVELQEDLKRVTKDPNRMSSELSELLCRHGYGKKPQSKHLVLEPRGGFQGLEALTISTSPSDVRGLKNMQKQVERALGLTKLI